MDGDKALIIEARRRVTSTARLTARPNHFELQLLALRERRIHEWKMAEIPHPPDDS